MRFPVPCRMSSRVLHSTRAPCPLSPWLALLTPTSSPLQCLGKSSPLLLDSSCPVSSLLPGVTSAQMSPPQGGPVIPSFRHSQCVPILTHLIPFQSSSPEHRAASGDILIHIQIVLKWKGGCAVAGTSLTYFPPFQPLLQCLAHSRSSANMCFLGASIDLRVCSHYAKY